MSKSKPSGSVGRQSKACSETEHEGFLKSTIVAIAITLALVGSAFAQKPRANSTTFDLAGEGTFSLIVSGHNDWIDHTHCQNEGEWHCSGEWEAPTGTANVCVLRTSDNSDVFLNCEDGQNLGFFAKVKYHVAGNKKTATALLITEAGKEYTLRVLRINTEDAGVKKARIELCQQGMLKGDRCSDVAKEAK